MSRLLPGFLFFVLTALHGSFLPAQTLRLEPLGIEQGLSQGLVSQILQDRRGFLWFATKNGLNRYDGYTFVVYRHDPYDAYSLPDDEVYDVIELPGDLLCVATARGLSIFDLHTQRFHAIRPSMEACHVRTILYTDHRQQIWAIVGPSFVDKLYPVKLAGDLSDRLRRGEPIDQLIQFGPASAVPASRGAVDTSAGVFWTNYRDSLSRWGFDGRRTAVMRLPEKPGGTSNLANIQLEPGSHAVWMTRGYNLCRFDPATGALQSRLLTSPGTPVVDETRIWIVNPTMVYGYDRARLPDVLTPENAVLKLPIQATRIIYTDRFGTVWFGTDGFGAFKYDPRTSVFTNYLPKQSLYSPLFVLPDGRIWIDYIALPTRSNLVFDPASGLLSAGSPWDSPGYFYRRATRDDQGRIWLVGTRHDDESLQGVLTRYDPRTGATRHFHFTSACPGPWGAIKHLPGGEIWIALPRQLLIFNGAEERFVVSDFTLPETQCDAMFAIEKTADGSVWIAGANGLYRFGGNPQPAPRYTLLKNDPQSRNSLPHNQVKTLLVDPADGHTLWIGTSGGLSRFDTRTGNFVHYNTRNGLPDNVVYALLADAHGFIWISTNKGLARLEPSTGRFQYFYKSDGLPENEFNSWAYGQLPDGRLMFGGVNGLTIFDPRQLAPQTQRPNVSITSLLTNNRPRTPRDSTGVLAAAIEFSGAVTLPFDENNLTIAFSALDHTNPARNRYRFYLEGAEEPWVHEGFEHTAHYLRLEPGTYTFKVLGTNSDGVWATEPTTLRITIRPPWYRTTLAWIVYAVVLVGSVFSLYRFQLRQKLEHAENERLKELDAAKTRLYTNITHEFRTPLTVILGMNDQQRRYLTEASGLEANRAVGQHARNLVNLINQLLDLARLESGSLRLHPVSGDVVAFVRYVVESFRSFASGKNITLHFSSNLATLNLAYDADKLQMIVGNLVSNALKFTGKDGQVWVTVEAPPPDSPALHLTVRDTGPGIPAEKLPRIFDRFYQANDSTTRSAEGTGIGLAIVRELLKLMQGHIAVDSTVGQGTTFTVALPPLAGPAPAVPGLPLRHADLVPEPPPHATQPEPAAAHTVAGPRLLIVEDNPDVRRYLAACAAGLYNVDFAENGRLGIERALETVPDLIVSDVMMPEKDGFELCRTLKDDERTSHIPIVLLTARADAASRIEGLRRGADDYLAKPFDREELLVRLDNLVAQRRRLQARYASLEAPAPTTDPDVAIEDAFVQKIRTYIEAQLDNADLSVEDLCRVAGMSRTNLHLKLTALTGQSAMQYVRSLRLEHAKTLLANGALNVSEVAYAVGFDDAKYFSRVFSEAFGVRPTQFRKEKS